MMRAKHFENSFMKVKKVREGYQDIEREKE